ncbi:radical SAM protein [bacterium]|nr:radical SAM protein [bacterium]
MTDSGTYIERRQAELSVIDRYRRSILQHVDLELTERCNNNCIHCCINLPADHPSASREMDADKIAGLLDQAAQLGCRSLRMTGGEPLLRPDFEPLYLRAKKLGMNISLFTNATLISPGLADLFARVPPGKPIEVSLYGMSRAAYERVSRSAGSFTRAWQGLRLLLERDVAVGIKTARFRFNHQDLEEMDQWTRRNIPSQKRPPVDTAMFYLRNRHDSPSRDDEIRRLRPTPEEFGRLLGLRGSADRVCLSDFCRQNLAIQGDDLFTCSAGLSQVAIDAYGFFQPCQVLRHPLAVVHSDSISLKDYLTICTVKIRKMKAAHSHYLNQCANCFLKALCSQCPAMSWMEHGDLDTPVKFLCDLAHVRAVQLGLLRKGERAWQVRDWRERIERQSEGTSDALNNRDLEYVGQAQESEYR